MLFGNALDLGQALTNPIEGNTGNLGNFETQVLKQLPFFPGNVFGVRFIGAVSCSDSPEMIQRADQIAVEPVKTDVQRVV